MHRNKISLIAAAAVGLTWAAGSGVAGNHKDDHEKVTLASASDIIGMDIETNDGHEAGEIEYLLVDSTSGKVRYALIEEDDELELEDDQLVALPFSALNLENADSDEIEANVSLAQLAGALTVDEDAIDEFIKPALITRVYDHFQIPEQDRLAGNSKGESDDGAEDTEEDAGMPHLMVTRAAVTTLVPGLSRAERIIGADVRTRGDEDLGEIEELVLNATDGSVAYVLVGQGGFLGIGEEYTAMPLQSLTWNAEDETYVAGMVADKRFQKLTKSRLPASVRKSDLDDFYKSYKIDMAN